MAKFLSIFFIIALMLSFQYALGARIVRDTETTPAAPALDSQGIQKAIEQAVDGFQEFLNKHISQDQLDQYKKDFEKFSETVMDKSKNILADLSKASNSNKQEPAA